MLIVAHSLGAVVARRALLDAGRRGESWAGKARLLLFGPAHLGTRLMELQTMLKSQPMQFLSDLFTLSRLKMPVLADLEHGSNFLAELSQESGTAIGAGETAHIAGKVWVGETDNVVVMGRFCSDPDADVAEAEDHCSVCRMRKAVHLVGAQL